MLNEGLFSNAGRIRLHPGTLKRTAGFCCEACATLCKPVNQALRPGYGSGYPYGGGYGYGYGANAADAERLQMLRLVTGLGTAVPQVGNSALQLVQGANPP